MLPADFRPPTVVHWAFKQTAQLGQNWTEKTFTKLNYKVLVQNSTTTFDLQLCSMLGKNMHRWVDGPSLGSTRSSLCRSQEWRWGNQTLGAQTTYILCPTNYPWTFRIYLHSLLTIKSYHVVHFERVRMNFCQFSFIVENLIVLPSILKARNPYMQYWHFPNNVSLPPSINRGIHPHLNVPIQLPLVLIDFYLLLLSVLTDWFE